MTRTVFLNAMVAHVWWSRAQQYGRNANDTLRFEGPTIHSYSEPIATMVFNDGQDELHLADRFIRAVLVTSRSFSSTTSAHTSEVRRAITAGTLIVPVHVMPSRYTRTSAETHEINLEHWHKEIAERLLKAKRSRVNGLYHLHSARELADHARAYCDIYSLVGHDFALPEDMDDALIAAHGEVEALMPYLHLPVQSGSDRVLKAMNRAHTADSYLRLIERIRAARPDIALSGDFIVGFPGETEAEFQATLDLIAAVNYASAFSFKYSRRPGTPAAAMADQVDEAVKSERLARLQSLIDIHHDGFNAAMVGRTVPVLYERLGRYEGQVVGRSPYLQGVHAEGAAALIGRIVDTEITGWSRNSLTGRIARSAAVAA